MKPISYRGIRDALAGDRAALRTCPVLTPHITHNMKTKSTPTAITTRRRAAAVAAVAVIPPSEKGWADAIALPVPPVSTTPEDGIAAAIATLEKSPRGKASLRALREFLSPTVQGLDKDGMVALMTLIAYGLNDYKCTVPVMLDHAATAGGY